MGGGGRFELRRDVVGARFRAGSAAGRLRLPMLSLPQGIIGVELYAYGPPCRGDLLGVGERLGAGDACC